MEFPAGGRFQIKTAVRARMRSIAKTAFCAARNIVKYTSAVPPIVTVSTLRIFVGHLWHSLCRCTETLVDVPIRLYGSTPSGVVPMLTSDPLCLTTVASLIASLSSLVWAVGRKR